MCERERESVCVCVCVYVCVCVCVMSGCVWCLVVYLCVRAYLLCICCPDDKKKTNKDTVFLLQSLTSVRLYMKFSQWHVMPTQDVFLGPPLRTYVHEYIHTRQHKHTHNMHTNTHTNIHAHLILTSNVYMHPRSSRLFPTSVLDPSK